MSKPQGKVFVDESGVTHWKREFGADVAHIILKRLKENMRIKDVSVYDVREDLNKLYPNRTLTLGAFRVYKCRLKKVLSNDTKNSAKA